MNVDNPFRLFMYSSPSSDGFHRRICAQSRNQLLKKILWFLFSVWSSHNLIHHTYEYFVKWYFVLHRLQPDQFENRYTNIPQKDFHFFKFIYRFLLSIRSLGISFLSRFVYNFLERRKKKKYVNGSHWMLDTSHLYRLSDVLRLLFFFNLDTILLLIHCKFCRLNQATQMLKKISEFCKYYNHSFGRFWLCIFFEPFHVVTNGYCVRQWRTLWKSIWESCNILYEGFRVMYVYCYET